MSTSTTGAQAPQTQITKTRIQKLRERLRTGLDGIGTTLLPTSMLRAIEGPKDTTPLVHIANEPPEAIGQIRSVPIGDGLVVHAHTTPKTTEDTTDYFTPNEKRAKQKRHEQHKTLHKIEGWGKTIGVMGLSATFGIWLSSMFGVSPELGVAVGVTVGAYAISAAARRKLRKDQKAAKERADAAKAKSNLYVPTPIDKTAIPYFN